MSPVDRRAFLRSSIAGTTAAALGGGIGLARERGSRFPQEREPTAVLHHESLIIQPGTLIRSTEGMARDRSLWAFSEDAEAALPLLLDPFLPDLTEAEQWANGDGTAAAASPTGSVLSVIAAHAPLGPHVAPEVTLRASEVLGSSNPESTFTLDFFPQLNDSPNVISSAGLPLMAPAPQVSAANYVPILEMYGWRLQYRPPHVHTLGSCVTSQVNHIHLEIMKQDKYNPKRWPTVMTLHLGVYPSGGKKCLVLWNSPSPYVCWKVCSPTRNDLQNMLAWALVAAAAVAGVVLAGWAVAAMASAGATALYVPVLIAL